MSSPTPECEFCGLMGHLEATCLYYKRFQAQAKEEAQSKRRKKKKKAPKAPKMESVGHARALVSSTSDGLQSDTDLNWIADTGATSHMTPHATITKLVRGDLVTGLVLSGKSQPDPICEPCLAGKMTSGSFPTSQLRTTST